MLGPSEEVGAYKWYQNLYLTDVQMRTSNLMRCVDCDNSGKVGQCANEFKCNMDTFQLNQDIFRPLEFKV